MNVVRCDYDGCEETRPADLDRTGWLNVTHDSLDTIGPVSWDFCCHVHLASWAKGRHDRMVRP